jgi:hypothetical protein
MWTSYLLGKCKSKPQWATLPPLGWL